MLHSSANMVKEHDIRHILPAPRTPKNSLQGIPSTMHQNQLHICLRFTATCRPSFHCTGPFVPAFFATSALSFGLRTPLGWTSRFLPFPLSGLGSGFPFPLPLLLSFCPFHPAPLPPKAAPVPFDLGIGFGFAFGAGVCRVAFARICLDWSGEILPV